MPEAADIPLPADPRAQRFADHVLAGKTLKDAYLAAGFQCSPRAATTGASRLRKQPDVVAYIAGMQARASDESLLTVLEIRRFCARIVRTPLGILDPEDDKDPNGDLVKSFAASVSETSSSKRWEKLDPLKAIEIDLKLSGQDPELNHLKQLADAITALGEGPLPSDRMPE